MIIQFITCILKIYNSKYQQGHPKSRKFPKTSVDMLHTGDTYYDANISFSLTPVKDFFVKKSTGIKLSSPDKLFLLKQSIHPNDAGIFLDASMYFVSMALVKWIHKTSDFSVISYVEHSIFWSCPLSY